MTLEEVRAVLAHLGGTHRLVATLLYGGGLRLIEDLRLQVKDLDFGRRQLSVRHGKGRKDRLTSLPASARDLLQDHLADVHRLHERDLAAGKGCAPLPFAFGRKLGPSAAKAWEWQWVFPARRRAFDQRTGAVVRYHLHPSAAQRAVRQAARAAGLEKRITTHTFRHSFATHLLETGTDILPIPDLLFFNDTATTEIYTHVARSGPHGVTSPADRL
jgi:site-specific recombinase XerD